MNRAILMSYNANKTRNILLTILLIAPLFVAGIAAANQYVFAGGVSEEDNDQDGFTPSQGDCDDTDAAVNPDATEVDNGIDDNCDGNIDEGFDTDNDGFTPFGGDCDDADNTIFPGTLDIPNDGIDQNCSGVDALEACSNGNVICKVADPTDDGDGIIEIGEVVTFDMVITVTNLSGQTWTSTIVKDRFGAELFVDNCIPSGTGNFADDLVALPTIGNSNKVKLVWVIGTLLDTKTAVLTCDVVTDLDPGGNQSYTECSNHEFNSGATLKFRNEAMKQRSFESGGIIISVLTVDAAGDCDGDGVIDNVDLCPHRGLEETGFVDIDGCPEEGD